MNEYNHLWTQGCGRRDWTNPSLQYMCVYAHTHIYTAQDSDVSPRVGTSHLKSPKNPDEPNLGMYVIVYVYKVHIGMMCMMFINNRNS